MFFRESKNAMSLVRPTQSYTFRVTVGKVVV